MDKIRIKTSAEIEIMRKAGQIVALVLQELGRRAQPGVTTEYLDRIAEEMIRDLGGIPSFKGYRGYPKATCISVNEQVVHGIPGPLVLEEGDVVGLDLGVYLEGYHADGAITVGVGVVSEEAQRLLRVTEECLYKGISKARGGARLGDISFAIQRHAEANGFSVVRELVGHGVGRDLHEPPEVPNFGLPGKGVKLREGMTLAIEPMINQGRPEVKVLPDKWTIVTADRKLSAHFEHTIAITRMGADILTLPPNGSEKKEVCPKKKEYK